MAVTTRRALPLIEETASPDVPRDMNALAEAADVEDPGQLPIGAEAEYAGEGDPNAFWLVEDGRAISRVTYKKLFEKLGTKWGAGDGVNTFNIPDTKGRVSVGAGAGAGLTNRSITQTGGEENHKLVLGEVPAHSHTMEVVYTDPGAHIGGDTRIRDDSVAFEFRQITTSSVGGGGSHNNMQPFVVKPKIIRVL